MESQSVARPKVFYGWWIIAGCLVMSIAHGALGPYSFGVFLRPLTEEFGWTRGQLSLAVTIGSFAGAVSGPFVGRWVDRHGPRGIMLLGALASGTAFALRSLTPSIWYFYAIFLIGALGGALAGNVPVNTIVTNWFVEKRGLAMGIKATGIGWGGLIMVPVATWLILTFDWRIAYAVLGVFIVAVNLLVVLLLMRWLRPEDKGLLPDGKVSIAQETPATPVAVEKKELPKSTWSLKTVSRTPAFYLLWLGLYLAYVGQASIMFHGIPLFEGRGASTPMAASLMSTIAFLGIVGKLVAGYIADRITARRVAVCVFCLHAVALVVLLNTKGVSTLWLFVLMYGLALGGLGTMAPLLVGQLFGRASFGAIFGTIGIAVTAGVGTGPTLIGFIFDAAGSYNPALMLYVGTHLLAVALIFLARPPKPVVPSIPTATSA